MGLYYPQGSIQLRVTWEDFGTGDPVLTEISEMDVLCSHLKVERNDYTEADTFSATIDYKSFPFDPRCIRAIGVKVFMSDQRAIFKDSNELNLIDGDTNNIVFIGFADESSVMYNDDKREVSIEGRDFTSLLIDRKRTIAGTVSLARPIDQILQSLINELKSTENIEVVNRTGSPLPIPSNLAGDLDVNKSVKNRKKGQNYWDIMNQIVKNYGLIIFIELDKLIISRPQNIYEKKQLKQFIYGGNIKGLSFKRKIGRVREFNVRCVSLSVSSKEVFKVAVPQDAVSPRFIAQFGNTAKTISELDKDGNKVEPPRTAPFYSFPIKDVASRESLISIAEGIYEEIGRQQIEGSFKTFEMEIPEENGGIVSPIKFSQLRNGSAIRIFLKQEEIDKISSDSTEEEKVSFLKSRGYPARLATAFAKSLDKINTAFYVKSVKFTIDKSSGFMMDIDFVNFIDIDSALIRNN